MKRILLSFTLIQALVSCGIEATGEGEGNDGVGTNEYRIFVTSSTTDGDMGGLAGADTLCTNAANSAGLSRNYKALLSTSSTDAVNRLNFTGPIYVVSQGVKTLIAGSGSELWNDNTNNGARIDKDENGLTVSGSVWTGTNSDGTLFTSQACSDWTSTAAVGWTGSTDQFDDRWVESTSGTCVSEFHIYCVSQ
jgi:hypothetical protein